MSLLNQYLNNKLAMQKAASAQEDVIPYLIKSSSAVGRVAAAIGKKLAQGAGKAAKPVNKVPNRVVRRPSSNSSSRRYNKKAVGLISGAAGTLGGLTGAGLGYYKGYDNGYNKGEVDGMIGEYKAPMKVDGGLTLPAPNKIQQNNLNAQELKAMQDYYKAYIEGKIIPEDDIYY